MTPAELEMQLHHVISALARFRYRFASEVQLHAGIAQALEDASVVYSREFEPSGSACRFDFWCPKSRIVIEAKVDNSMPAAARQVERYVQLEQCAAVVIAAAKSWADSCRKEFELNGKPVRIVRILSQAF